MALMAVLVSGAGCAEEEAPAARRPLGDVVSTTTAAETTTTTTTTAPVDPVRVEVEAAYRNAVRVAEEAAMIPDPDAPELAQWNTGPMLEEWRRRIEELRANGQRVTFPADTVRSIAFRDFELLSEGFAAVEVCEVDDALVVESGTGAVVNDRVSTSRNRGVLALGPEGWRLEQRETLERVDGVTC